MKRPHAKACLRPREDHEECPTSARGDTTSRPKPPKAPRSKAPRAFVFKAIAAYEQPSALEDGSEGFERGVLFEFPKFTTFRFGTRERYFEITFDAENPDEIEVRTCGDSILIAPNVSNSVRLMIGQA